MKLITILLAVYLTGFSQMLNAGPCRDRSINTTIKRMGPHVAAVSCPEWEYARQEYNVRRDVPRVAIPDAEYRVRLRTTNRR